MEVLESCVVDPVCHCIQHLCLSLYCSVIYEPLTKLQKGAAYSKKSGATSSFVENKYRLLVFSVMHACMFLRNQAVTAYPQTLVYSSRLTSLKSPYAGYSSWWLICLSLSSLPPTLHTSSLHPGATLSLSDILIKYGADFSMCSTDNPAEQVLKGSSNVAAGTVPRRSFIYMLGSD